MSKSKRKNKSLQKSVVDSEIDLTRKELSRKLKIENEAHNSKSKGEVNETLDQKLNDLCLESGTAVANKVNNSSVSIISSLFVLSTPN